MKRYNNLYNRIISVDNLNLGDVKTRKGKNNQFSILEHDENKTDNINKLHNSLINKTYNTSEYTTFVIKDPKERIIYRLPYYPDRILHHAIMNILEPIFIKSFTSDTYSCIKGRGIHGCSFKLQSALKDIDNTTYCLKLDIQKFYPSVDHVILKQIIRKKGTVSTSAMTMIQG